VSLILMRVSNPNDAPPGVGTSYVAEKWGSVKCKA